MQVNRESDEGIADLMSVQPSYDQLQVDYISGNYPVGNDDAAQLSALQILVEIGYVVKPETCSDWTSLLERFLPGQIANTRANTDWESDILNRYRSMENLTKEDARQQFLRILRMLPYGDSVFFSVSIVDDPIGLLPGRITLGINERGVHFFRQDPKEYLLLTEFRDIMQFGSSDTAMFFRMRVAGVLHIFLFETKQAMEICVALKIHINDVVLRQYSEAPSAANSGPINVNGGEKRAQDLMTALVESQKNLKKLSEELREKQRKETSMQEEVETLKDMLRSQQQNLEELSSKYNELRTLCDEKESSLQAALIVQRDMEARLSQLSKGELENNTKKELVEATNQACLMER